MDYGWSEDYVLYELPMIRGWVYYAYAMENSGWLNFAGVKRQGAGYIKQQTETLMEQAKKHYGW